MVPCTLWTCAPGPDAEVSFAADGDALVLTPEGVVPASRQEGRVTATPFDLVGTCEGLVSDIQESGDSDLMRRALLALCRSFVQDLRKAVAEIRVHASRRRLNTLAFVEWERPRVAFLDSRQDPDPSVASGPHKVGWQVTAAVGLMVYNSGSKFSDKVLSFELTDLDFPIPPDVWPVNPFLGSIEDLELVRDVLSVYLVDGLYLGLARKGR